IVFLVVAIGDLAILDGGDFVLFGSVDFLDPVEVVVVVGIVGVIAVIAGIIAVIGLIVFFGAQACFFLGMLRLFGEQRFAIFLRDLVVVGVDFAEGEEAVAVTAKVDESRLQRWFYPGNLGKIDI